MRSARIARIAASAAVIACLAPPATAGADDVSFVTGPGSPFDTEYVTRDMLVADFDEDGHGDVLVGDVFGISVKVLWGQADGNVAEVDTFPAEDGSEHLAIGDLNGDGDLDFVTAAGSVRPYLKVPGARDFTAGTAIPVDAGGETFHSARGVAIAKFDADADNDVAFTAHDSNSGDPRGRYRILTNDGSGALSLAGEGPDHEAVGEIVTGRFNDDNDPDLAYRFADAAADPSDNVRVVLGAAGAGFGSPADYPINDEFDFSGFENLAAADLDAPPDGFTDLVVEGSVTVRWAKGDGTFTAGDTFDSGFVDELRIGDVTGDGRPDIVAADAPLRLLVNRGSRSFTRGITLPMPPNVFFVAAGVGDLDSDPRDDLALAMDADEDFDDEVYKLLTRDPPAPPPDDGTTGGGGGTGPTVDPPSADPPAIGPIQPPTGGPVVIPVTARQIALLPAKRRCGSRRNFRIRLRRPPEGVGVVEARVLVNGRRVAVRRGARLTAPVDLRGMPKGRAVVTIRIKLTDGRVLRGRRVYRPCATKRRGSRRFPKSRG